METTNGYSLVENMTINSTNPSVAEPLVVAIVVPIAFAIIFVVGLIGNSILIYIIVKNAPMHTKPNVLIVSLALGDFLLILVSVPFTSTIYTFDQWYYGQVVCKINEFMQTLSLGVSVFTLMALSADRFVAIVYPFTAYCSVTMGKIRAAAVSIWIISILLALVDLVGADVRPCPVCFPEIYVCNVHPPEWGKMYEPIRKVARFLIYFVIPVVVIATLYSLIACVLLSTPENGLTRNSVTSTSTVIRRMDSRKRVAKVVLFFVIIFIVCWFPRHFYILWFQFAVFEYDLSIHILKLAGFCLCFIYSAVNPLALYFLNEDFRRYFRYYLFGRCNRNWSRPPSAVRMNSLQSSTIRYSVV